MLQIFTASRLNTAYTLTLNEIQKTQNAFVESQLENLVSIDLLYAHSLRNSANAL